MSPADQAARLQHIATWLHNAPVHQVPLPRAGKVAGVWLWRVGRGPRTPDGLRLYIVLSELWPLWDEKRSGRPWWCAMLGGAKVGAIHAAAPATDEAGALSQLLEELTLLGARVESGAHNDIGAELLEQLRDIIEGAWA